MSTGGSTGSPVTVLVDRERAALADAIRLRCHRWYDAGPGTREIALWGSPIESTKQDRVRTLRDHLINSKFLSAFDLGEATLARYAQVVRRYRPQKLFGYASALALLAGYLQREGWSPEPGRVRWSLDPGARVVLADPGLLDRVLGNIIENALRHQPPPGCVRVSTSSLGNRAEIRVVDTGPGVPETERERIFLPFQRQGDAPAGDGVGLGLAVARGLAEAMGGAVTAEDTPGGGLTLVIALPLHGGTSPEGTR